ncbi:hypothetical protein AB0H37_38305 [Actinomadura sp. NPDC023710]|uniref:hypothetical protein n=1 Tax=Actinomadura sp. NPDC023710 TaxID=3158219 RepID=UPI0033E4C75D
MPEKPVRAVSGAGAGQTSLSLALDSLADLADLVGRGSYPVAAALAEIARALEPLTFTAHVFHGFIAVAVAQTTQARDRQARTLDLPALDSALAHLTHGEKAMRTVGHLLTSGRTEPDRAAGKQLINQRPEPPPWSSTF